MVAACNALDANYFKGITNNQGRTGVIVTENIKVKENTKLGYTLAKEGDGVNFGAPGSHTRRGRVGDQEVNTLTTKDEQGVVVRQQGGETVLRIRKLTPRECWRLQAWGVARDDGSWDDTAFEKAKASGTSDSQLYKQAGNGCSANVVEAIGLAILQAEREAENG